LSTVGIDDRNFLESGLPPTSPFYVYLGCVLQLEKILTLMSRLPEDSTFSAGLQRFFIDIRELSFADGSIFEAGATISDIQRH